MFSNIPQSSQTESLGFTSYPLPLDTPPLGTLQWKKNFFKLEASKIGFKEFQPQTPKNMVF